ncbi:MAG: hypothetical protein JXA11_06540 [Phycisphaerae bacterium]|nr:hypothetical protein [Phycisphaerae bacterium]
MAKGLRAFFAKFKQKSPVSTLPATVSFQRPDGGSLDIPTQAVVTGSGSFRTHKVVSTPPDVLEIKHTIGFQIYSLLFSLLGIVTLVLLYPLMLRSAKTPADFVGVFFAVLLFLSFVVLGMGGLTGWLGIPLTVMDRRVGLYWKRRIPKKARTWARPPLPLESIAAVQICSGRVRSQYGNYTVHQINLVTADPPGERFCLISHGKKNAIRNDARQIAEFLHRPLLDHSFEE